MKAILAFLLIVSGILMGALGTIALFAEKKWNLELERGRFLAENYERFYWWYFAAIIVGLFLEFLGLYLFMNNSSPVRHRECRHE